MEQRRRAPPDVELDGRRRKTSGHANVRVQSPRQRAKRSAATLAGNHPPKSNETPACSGFLSQTLRFPGSPSAGRHVLRVSGRLVLRLLVSGGGRFPRRWLLFSGLGFGRALGRGLVGRGLRLFGRDLGCGRRGFGGRGWLLAGRGARRLGGRCGFRRWLRAGLGVRSCGGTGFGRLCALAFNAFYRFRRGSGLAFSPGGASFGVSAAGAWMFGAVELDSRRSGDSRRRW